VVLPRSLVLAALLVTAAVSMVALAPSRATPSGAIDFDDATWTISGEGAVTQNPRILGRLLWLFMDSTGYLRFCDCKRSSSVVIWG
jgi:hypothetical protein